MGRDQKLKPPRPEIIVFQLIQKSPGLTAAHLIISGHSPEIVSKSEVVYRVSAGIAHFALRGTFLKLQPGSGRSSVSIPPGTTYSYWGEFGADVEARSRCQPDSDFEPAPGNASGQECQHEQTLPAVHSFGGLPQSFESFGG